MWKDFKWVEKRFGTKFANILKGFDKGSKEIEEHFTTKENHEVTFTDANGVQNTLVTEQGISEVLAKNGLIEVTWQELKDKRDNGELIPGSLYRITDYNCTTTQENTRSAGHQFDIVLLALSNDKLAEEGWAMEHPTDVYDVTFADGVTKKCWWYKDREPTEGVWYYNLVDCNILVGAAEVTLDDVIINESDKTITALFGYDDAMIDENLTYNYFQNSNLSAWKVWYCLDNDTARFAWADDREGYLISGQSDFGIWDSQLILRAPGWDSGDKYGWEIVGTDVGIWTKTLDINVGQLEIYNSSDDLLGVATVSSAIKVYNGRGVIYRMIDEWNNDVAYDFKNIQFVRKLTDGEYDPDNGTNTWVYTFSYWYNDGVIDSSTEGQTFTDDAGDIAHICENTIKARNIGGKYELSNNVIYGQPDGEWYYGAKFINIDGDSNINTILGYLNISLNYSYQTIIESNAILLYRCSVTSFTNDAIYIRNKKVLTES